MARSSESVARRSSASREWSASPEGRAYHKADRAAHPEREQARRVRWKAANPDKVKAQEARRAARIGVADTSPMVVTDEVLVPRYVALRDDIKQAKALMRLEGARIGHVKAQGRFMAWLTAERAWMNLSVSPAEWAEQ